MHLPPPPLLPKLSASLLEEHLSLDLGSTQLIHNDLMSKLLVTSANNLFPNKVPFPGSVHLDEDVFFWGPPLHPLHWPYLKEKKADSDSVGNTSPPFFPCSPLSKKNWVLEKEKLGEEKGGR